MFVSGASGTSVTRLPGVRGRQQDVAEQLDRVGRRQSGSRRRRARAQPEVAHAVLAVDVPGAGRAGSSSGRSAPAAHRHVGRPAASSTIRVLRTTSSTGALPATQVTARRSRAGWQGGEQQGAGVVDAGVDVEHEGIGTLARLTRRTVTQRARPRLQHLAAGAGQGSSRDAVH